MYRCVAQHLPLRTAIVLTICLALLPLPGLFPLISEAAQGQERQPRPRRGKPEGFLPNLEAVKEESGREREAEPPIPSTVRAPRSPLQPWNGKRVGDPGTRGELGQGAPAAVASAARL